MAPLALPACDAATRDRALEVLLDDALRPIVDLVAWSVEPGCFELASSTGHVAFRRTDATGTARPTYVDEVRRGVNPVANQDPSHLGTLDLERTTPHPACEDNAYPFAYEHLAQVFDHPSAPDLVVLHTGAHYWGDQGGHLGEHGSLGVLQARAPFLASGAGVRRAGMVDASCRLVDVYPTVLSLLGIDPSPGPRDQTIALDGTALDGVVAEPGGADHVVGILMDGTNPNVLYDLIARGEAPNLARLVERGIGHRFGAIASLPTVTLANHTAILTGRHPGHHGVLHNAWIDRATAAQVVTNSPSTWTSAMQWLDAGATTIHDAVHRARPGATSISINEPCDTGADFSIFDLLRRGETIDRAPRADELPDATERFVRPSKDYQWSSRIDHTAVEQFCGIWSGTYRGRAWARPTFSWVNFTLTDAAFHEGGPYSDIAAASVRDTDARIGKLLDAVERSGAFDRTAFVVVADHGMQLADELVTGDWDTALRATGIDVRDEGYGFLYLP